MNIYKFEIKMLRNSILIWGSAIAAGLLMYMAFYPLMMEDNAAMEALMANFPEEFLAFFGMNKNLPFTSLLGYYGLTYSFIMIPIAIQASNYGFHMLSVEERELTADFLLTKPISRKTIIISKFLASFTGLTITNVIVWLSSFIALSLFNGNTEVDYTNVFVLLSSVVLFQLFFVSVGMLISVSVKKVTSVISYSMGLGFGLFILSSIGEMLSSSMFRIFSPYSHFEPIHILSEGTYNWGLVIITIAVTIFSLSLSYFLYLRRNIASL